MPLDDPPKSTRTIRSYHAHIYFRDAEERARALLLRAWIDARFSVQLGRVHDVKVGPHDQPMYQVAFSRALFEGFVPWLALNRGGLNVLIHPNTGRALDDHTAHALWLGEPLGVRGAVLTNAPDDDTGSDIVPNTHPVQQD